MHINTTCIIIPIQIQSIYQKYDLKLLLLSSTDLKKNEDFNIIVLLNETLSKQQLNTKMKKVKLFAEFDCKSRKWPD